MLSQIWDSSVLTQFIGRNDVFYPDVSYIHQSRFCRIWVRRIYDNHVNSNQLLSIEVNVIRKHLLYERFINWSSLSIYYQALRDNVVDMGIGTWYKYANRLGINRKFFRIKRKKVIGIRASNSLQILHMDVTMFTAHYIMIS